MDSIANYRLERRLGSGAFATVWLGYDEQLDGHVAIKVLADNWAHEDDIRRRFLHEARLLWKSDNPRLVNVHTVGELETGQPYFVMEYADRGTLAQRLQTGPIPAAAAAGLVLELARCIGAVHELGAIHRDVKPANFLIRSTSSREHDPIPGLGPDERVMLADLGLAKVLAVSSGVTVAGGSPDYMAPEQAQPSTTLGPPADIFALGVTAYEVFAGRTPTPRGSLAGAAGFDLADVQPLSTIRGDIGEPIDAVLRRAMQPDPALRQPDVATFITELSAAAPQGATENFAALSKPPPAVPTEGPLAAAPQPAAPPVAAAASPARPAPTLLPSQPAPAPSAAARGRSVVPLLLGVFGVLAIAAVVILLVLRPGPSTTDADPDSATTATDEPAATAPSSAPAPSSAADTNGTSNSSTELPDWFVTPAGVSIDSVRAEDDRSIIAEGTYPVGSEEAICDDVLAQAENRGAIDPIVFCVDGSVSFVTARDDAFEGVDLNLDGQGNATISFITN